MITLLSDDKTIKYPISIDGNFNYIERSIERDLGRVISLYHNRVHYVNAKHILVRLLYQALAPITYDITSYTRAVESRIYDLSRHFRFTSSVSQGVGHQPSFYDRRCTEYYLLDDRYVSPYLVSGNWKNYESVKVIYHHESDLSMTLLTGGNRSSHYGPTVISINIVALMIQFREFLISQAVSFKETGSFLGAEHFVNMYILPNMLKSHLQISVFNRMVNLSLGRPNSECYMKLPIVVVDYREKLDKVLQISINRIKEPNLNYQAMVANIPMLFGNSTDVFSIPDIAYTRQVKWLLFLSRMEYIDWIINLNKEKITTNRRHINELYSISLQMKNEYTFKRILPYSDYMEVTMYINTFIDFIRVVG